MNPKRRRFALAAVAGVATWTRASAQAFPGKPIRIVAPTGPGVSPDIVSRIFAEHLSKSLGQPVVVENKPGASGMIGAEVAATAAADGHTLLFGYTALMSMNPHLYGTARFDPRARFAPVAHLLNTPFVLTAFPGVPYNTISELGEYAKAHPGEVAFGSAGPGSHSRVATELIASRLGVRMTHVPYPSEPGGDLLSGRVQVYLDPAATAVPLIRAGKVKALAVATAGRLAQLPSVPTVAETLPGLASSSLIGFYVPKQTPQAVIDLLAQEMNKVLKVPAVSQRFQDMGYEIVGSTPQEFERRWQEDYAQWGKVIREAGIRLE